MSTIKIIEKIQNNILKDVTDYHQDFLQLFEEYKGTETEKFIEKFLEWYVGDHSLLLYKMFSLISRWDKHTFFLELNRFIINYFYDDSSFRIVWLQNKYFNKFLEPWRLVLENMSIPEEYITDEDQDDSDPVIAYDENGSQEQSLILGAMEKYESKTLEREKRYATKLEKIRELILKKQNT